jgi:hypothetical protein
MTVFVETTSGALISLSKITSVSRIYQRTNRHGVEMDYRTVHCDEGGEKQVVEVFEHDLERALERASPIIPALPGTYRLNWGIDPNTDEEWLTKDPVIAWRIDEFGVANPVTCEMSSSDPSVLLLPDGQVVDPDVQSWSDVEFFKKTMREKKKADAA